MDIREIPASVSPDPPEPAKPGEFQTVTLGRQRTTDEVKRADQARDPVFRASNGARFEAALQLTDAGAQASFKIFAEVGRCHQDYFGLASLPDRAAGLALARQERVSPWLRSLSVGERDLIRTGALAALLALGLSGPAAAETVLYTGVNGPPPGWAEAMTYSIRSAADCRKLLATVRPEQRRGLSCISRVDPNAKLPPMS